VKLAMFSTRESPIARVGIVTCAGMIDIAATASGHPATMEDLIARWDELKPRLGEMEESSSVRRYPASTVRLHAPIKKPGKVAAIGLNYADHILESKLEQPKVQLWFAKATSSLHDPFEPIQIPRVSDQVDYEAELVAIIGKRAKHLSSESARSAVFGYCAGNDVSVRDWQMQTPQWFLGKSFDTHAPIGPWIVTADEIPDPHDLNIRCFVNSELRQSSNTRHLVFNVFEQVAHLSEVMTLEPSDLIFTGTPGGVGWASEPKAFLREGDTVRVEIERIGSIEAKMITE
jgi:ureidoglycolate lyase